MIVISVYGFLVLVETLLILASFIEYVDINPEGRTTLLMVHGWPSLWSTWSNQIQEFRVGPTVPFPAAIHKFDRAH